MPAGFTGVCLDMNPVVCLASGRLCLALHLLSYTICNDLFFIF